MCDSAPAGCAAAARALAPSAPTRSHIAEGAHPAAREDTAREDILRSGVDIVIEEERLKAHSYVVVAGSTFYVSHTHSKNHCKTRSICRSDECTYIPACAGFLP